MILSIMKKVFYMVNELDNPISICGLDCSKCDIYLCDEDEIIAERMLSWFKKQGWRPDSTTVQEFMQEGKFCEGCRGNRERHWSSNCKLLICCLDEKGLDSCHKCADFICEKLEAWGKSNEKYAQGIEQLKKLN
ncbi:MAG: DUF3795 domain-containing protein [Candidatus Heimdallarchaeota archaeon]